MKTSNNDFVKVRVENSTNIFFYFETPTFLYRFLKNTLFVIIQNFIFNGLNAFTVEKEPERKLFDLIVAKYSDDFIF